MHWGMMVHPVAISSIRWNQLSSAERVRWCPVRSCSSSCSCSPG